MGNSYAELMVASNYSFLRGASHPEELVVTAAMLGHQALAVTDRNSVSGIVRAHAVAKTAGIQFIPATRLDLMDDEGALSLLVYPETMQAYGRLCQLLSLGKRRAPKGECHLWLTDVLAGGVINSCRIIVLPPSRLDPDFGFFPTMVRCATCQLW